jgi:hypothetical protein
MTITQLDGLRIHKRTVERLGCIKGCLDYLGRDVSLPWLYGCTGHAFIISLDPGVDVSSPDSWNHQPQFDLGPNLGYTIDGFSVFKPDAGEAFPAKQREAWEFVRTNIDRGVPCFGFELKAYYGGFWVIYGYDDGTGDQPAGYYFSGWEEGGPTPWDKLGELFIPVLAVHSVQLTDPAPDAVAIKAGLEYAIKHAQNPAEWIDEQAQSGPAAWAYWAKALESGEAKRDHHTYNAQLWLECRQAAVEFFAEAKQRVPGRCDAALDRAAEQYGTICTGLEAVIALHPQREKPNWGPDSTFASAEAAALIRQAGEADAEGLNCLREIVDAL